MANRTILITGASGIIGQALVTHFLRLGDEVIGVTRSLASADRLGAIHGGSGSLRVMTSDLTCSGAVSRLLEELGSEKKFPDGLVNAARSVEFLAIRDDGAVDRASFVGEFLLDVVVPYELVFGLCVQAGSRLRRVVNIGSQYGVVAANPGLYRLPAAESPIQYSVAKAALAHLTREMAVRLAPRGIQVNCVALGGVEGRADEEFMGRYAQFCPSGRMLRVEEVVAPVDLLLSEGGSGITGHVLVVDGGWSIW